MNHLDNSNIDFIMFNNELGIGVPSLRKDNHLFYTQLQNAFKGLSLDIYVKEFDRDCVTSLKGTILEIDTKGKYIVVQEVNAGKDFIYFSRIEDAILAIQDEKGNILYRNISIYGQENYVIRSQADVNCLRGMGVFSPELFNYMPRLVPEINIERNQESKANPSMQLHRA